MKVGITVPDRKSVRGSYLNYFSWLEGIADTIPISDKNDLGISLDALILSGGGDLNAKRYGEENIRTEKISDTRDEFEFFALDKALNRKIPILGICRGMQLINVFFNGSLWQDIDQFGAITLEHTDIDGKDKIHKIKILKNTLLYTIVQEEIIEVNSHHHESIKTPGESLKISAYSLKDAVVEGIENPELKIIGVQWHPERCRSITSTKLLKGFLNLI